MSQRPTAAWTPSCSTNSRLKVQYAQLDTTMASYSDVGGLMGSSAARRCVSELRDTVHSLLEEKKNLVCQSHQQQRRIEELTAQVTNVQRPNPCSHVTHVQLVHLSPVYAQIDVVPGSLRRRVQGSKMASAADQSDQTVFVCFNNSHTHCALTSLRYDVDVHGSTMCWLHANSRWKVPPAP